MPTTEWRARRDDVPGLGTEVRRTLAEWNVTTPFVDMWLRTTIERLAPDDEVTVCVDYDADIRLLSFDATVGGRRVYGADDFVM